MAHSLEEIGEEIIRQFVEMNRNLQGIIDTIENGQDKIVRAVENVQIILDEMVDDTVHIGLAARKMAGMLDDE